MFRIEVERVDGDKFFYDGVWEYPERADAEAERLWARLNWTEEFAKFSVIEQDGTVYSEWEV
jgi:hypothetical protein